MVKKRRVTYCHCSIHCGHRTEHRLVTVGYKDCQGGLVDRAKDRTRRWSKALSDSRRHCLKLMGVEERKEGEVKNGVSRGSSNVCYRGKTFPAPAAGIYIFLFFLSLWACCLSIILFCIILILIFLESKNHRWSTYDQETSAWKAREVTIRGRTIAAVSWSTHDFRQSSD